MSILFVTGIEGARNCADVVGKLLDMEVVIAEGRKGALALLRQREFAALPVPLLRAKSVNHLLLHRLSITEAHDEGNTRPPIRLH